MARDGFDEIWSLGDLVGPDPDGCTDLLRGHQHPTIAGNRWITKGQRA